MASKYLDIFIKEAEEHLTSLQQGLLLLEKEAGNAKLIHELLRNAHTLKGSARMIGIEDISTIAHRMEDILKDIEEGRKEVTAGVIDLLLQGSDAISRMTVALGKGEESPVDVEKFVAAFDQGESTADALKEKGHQEEETFGDTVRVKVKTLDNLVNLIGEMIINKKRFEDKNANLKLLCQEGEVAATGASLKEFQRSLEEDVLYLHYLIQELYGETMSLRMLPLRTVTDGFRRLVRDLAKDQGKEVELEIVGDGIEVDRVLLEMLKPMLLHILTNAIDHGIETPGERQEKKKPAKAVVRVVARHEGNNVWIVVRDDGRGMDPGKIKEVALRRGVLTADEADMLSDEEALYLTLRPGFSTSEIVTDISGRGVGMDVVKQNAERVKGNILLKSRVGSFTEISLQLPLTLSVIDALMITCAGETFAIPLSYVQETIKIRSDDITAVGGKETISVRGITTPLVPLANLLGIPGSMTLLESGKMSAVVLKLRDHCLACMIDGSLGSSEIVVKGLGGQFRNVKYVFGATILGDGSPALILNVPDIFASSEGAESTGLRKVFEESRTAGQRGYILVVDDSITTRTMERSILVAHGYRVELAVSGEDALEKVAGTRFDLVITDIEMPGIDGFELTKQLRCLEEYLEVPVIVVSSLSRDEDKRRAIDAGAQAYIVKGAFDQGALLDTVEALID